MTSRPWCERIAPSGMQTLSRVAVEGGTIDQVRTFYSCLYRMLFFPLALV